MTNNIISFVLVMKGSAEAAKAAKLEEEMYDDEDEFDVDDYEPSDEEILNIENA